MNDMILIQYYIS